MATGEMAAIIAHGFRNSLTSIKMILQLQQESKRLGPGNRKSVRVALDSIDRMESVVRELLNFARPLPMEFHPTDLNALVKESMALVGPRFGGTPGSVLQEPGFPDSAHGDGQRSHPGSAREYAAERSPGRRGKILRGTPKGRIRLATKRVLLLRTLRDLHSPVGYG
jgi:signal transduction histidine kinase